MKVAPADYCDLDNVIDLYKSALMEIGERAKFPISDERLNYSVRKNWNDMPCFVLKDDKENICGFAGFCLAREFFSDTMYMKDYMFFILPEHRNVRNLRLLCDAARQFAAKNNLLLQVNYLAGDRPEKQQRLMKQMGFEITGYIGVSE